MKIRRYNGSSWVQEYPEVGVSAIVATGTPSSTTFLRGDGAWAVPTAADGNNYLTGVSGSGDGTVTFTRSGLSNLTWDASHSHSEYLLTTGKAADANLLDGLDSAYYKNNTHTTHSASNLAVGWYTIATVPGDRGIARFALRDTASGRHQSVVFYAAHHYGTDASNTLTVLHQSSYGTTPFRYIRIKEGGTYDGAALQVYIDGTGSSVNVYMLGDNFQSSGWTLKDWIADATDPGNVSNYSSFVERGKIDLDQITQGGIATTGQIYAGGDTTQYKVFHDAYHPNADKWTTARTITLGGDLVGNVSLDGSANVTLSAAVANDSHTHDGRYYTETETNNLLAAKAPLASPALTGIPTAPTAAANTNTTQIATTAYVQGEITDLIGGAPGALDTLNELAAAINDDSSYASTITTALAGKVAKSGDTMTGTLTYTTLNGPSSQTRDKIRVWPSGSYAIGMKSGYTYGGLNNDYAMSFQMNDDNDRGFWWGDAEHTDAQGAMALTTNGLLTVASGARIGYGGSDTTAPVSGVINLKTNGSTPDSTTATYEKGLTIVGGNQRLNIDVSNVTNGGAYIQSRHESTSFPTSEYTLALNPQGGNVTINGNTAWHAGNDGSGSGLDADTLDGNQASAFYLASNPNGYTSNTGDITSVTAGTGLSGGGTSGAVTLNLDLSEFTDMTADVDGLQDEMILLDNGAERRKLLSEIKLSQFNNDAGWASGDIQGVTAGSGLTGGGTSGTVTVSHADTSSQASLTALTGANVISDIDVDTYGHITSMATRALTAANIGAASSSHNHSASEIVSGELNTARMGSGTATSGYVLKSDGDGTASWQVDNNTTYTLGSFGVTATAAELNKMDGVTATTAELNYTDGVTSNIQTQLNGKAASSHSHGVLTSSGTMGSTLTTVASGDKLVIADSSNSNALALSSIQFGTNTATFLRNDGSWAEPSGGAGGYEPEWEYVTKVTGASQMTYSSMAPASYEYKFVVEVQTTAEDTSNPYIRINNESGNEYSYQYSSVTQTAETTETVLNAGDALTSLIYTGADLSSYSSGGTSASTIHRAEFIYAVSPYTTSPGAYTATIRGWAHTHYVSQSGTSYDGMVQSTFVGTRDNLFFTEHERLDYIHDINAGSTDYHEMRVYRRPRK